MRVIDSYAFYECTRLGKISLPDSLYYIGDKAFSLCGKNRGYSTTDLTIPQSVNHIGAYAFDGFFRLNVTIPCSVTYIGAGCFRDVEITNGEVSCYYGSYLSKIWRSKDIGLKRVRTLTFEYYNDNNGDGDWRYRLSSDENGRYACLEKCTTKKSEITSIPDTITILGNSYKVNEIDSPFDAKVVKKVKIPNNINVISKIFYNEAGLKKSSLTVICDMDSEAYKYAKNNGYNVEINATPSSNTDIKTTNDQSQQNEQSAISQSAQRATQTSTAKDTTPPVITNVSVNIEKGYSSYVTLKWRAEDSGVGIKGYKLTDKKIKNNSGYTQYDKIYRWVETSYNVYSNGTYYLYIIDKNGNISEPATYNINGIDRECPEFKKVNVAQKMGFAQIEWTATDDKSGVRYWKISKKQNDWNGSYNDFKSNYKQKSDITKITEPGVYYLYIKDFVGNARCKTITINNIDKAKPKITNIKVQKIGDKQYITYSAEDSDSGLKQWKLSTNEYGTDGTFTKYTYEGKTALLSKVGIRNIEISKSGTYYLVLEDEVGYRTISDKLTVDATKPQISSIDYSVEKGAHINKTYYLKNKSTVTMRVTFTEDIKEIDTSKLVLSNKNIANVSVNKINSKIYDIIITGKTTAGTSTFTIENGFAKDAAGNDLVVNDIYKKITVVLDNKNPSLKSSQYTEDGQVSAKISSYSKIKKYQWKIVDDDKNPVWVGQIHDNLNKSELDTAITMYSNNGKVVELYVENILGNSSTFSIYPKIKADVTFLSKQDNIVTYKISMNLKAKIFQTYKNIINSNQTCPNCRVVDLVQSGSNEKEFLLTVDTNGSKIDEKIVLPKGVIYVQTPFNLSEASITIDVDSSDPTVNFDKVTKLNSKRSQVSISFSDQLSGIARYQIKIDDELLSDIEVSDIKEITKKITANKNSKIKVTVWDKIGNKTEKELTVQ